MATALEAGRNPFAISDPERREIWEMLMQRDFEAFVAADWSMVDDDFWPEGFYGIDARHSFNPDDWRISFPRLEVYRDEWLRQAHEFAMERFAETSTLDFLFDSCQLQDIEITEDRAVAHKKFNGKAATVDGREIVLRFQTFYQMVRRDDRWLISGFVGFLPYMVEATG